MGKFFRINIGKSGIGYSFGVKGARITQKGKGRVRSTLSIPRTGVSDSKSRKTPSTKRQELEVSDIQEQNVQCESEINENFNSCELQYIVKKIKKAFLLPKIFAILAVVAAVLLVLFNVAIHIAVKIALFSLAIISAVIFAILSSTYKVRLEYDIEDSVADETMKLQNTIRKFCKGFGIWTINSYKLTNEKQKGLYASIDRTQATFYEKPLAPIKTNAKCLTIKAKKNTYVFLPDMLIVFSGVKFSVISFSDIKFQCGKKNIEELLPATKGAKVVGTTWQRVTKTGEKDRRYSDNKQLAICEYGLICLYTDKGFQLNLLSTNSDNIQ